MEISMMSLCMGALTATMFGFLVWCVRVAWISATVLFIGEQAKRKVFLSVLREIGLGCYIVGSAVALVIFLYCVNNGEVRWFFTCSAFASYCLSVKMIERKICPSVYKGLLVIRNRCRKLLILMFKPLAVFLKKLRDFILKTCKKIALPIKQKCDKMRITKYDRKKRKQLRHTVVADFTKLLHERSKDGYQNDRSRRGHSSRP